MSSPMLLGRALRRCCRRSRRRVPTTEGHYYKDHQLILNGMLYQHATGIGWRDLPERYGPWPTWPRFRQWTCGGLWECNLEVLQRDVDSVGQID